MQFIVSSTAIPVPVGEQSTSLALGDLDNDGDLDIVFGNLGAVDRIYLNDGSGIFTESVPLPIGDTTDIAVGYLDLDGDLEIVRGPRRQVFQSVAPGIFANRTFRWIGAGAAAARAVGRIVLTDIDGDSDLDLLSAVTGDELLRTNTTRENLIAPSIPYLGGDYRLAIQHNSLFPHPNTVLFSPLAAVAPIPTPFGTLQLDPSLLIPIGSLGFPGMQGSTIPNNAALFGFEMLFQVLLIPPNDIPRPTNAVRDVIWR